MSRLSAGDLAPTKVHSGEIYFSDTPAAEDGMKSLSDKFRRGLGPGYLIAYMVIVAVAAISSAVLMVIGRTHPLPPPGQGSFPFVTFALAIVFLIAVLRPLYLVIKRHPHPTRQLATDILERRGWIATVGLMTIVLPHTLETATRFKKLIPQLSDFSWDVPIADLERALLGMDAWRFTHAIFGPAATRIFDTGYGMWHMVNIALLVWLVLTRDRRFQVQAVLTYQLSWLLLGGAMAIAFASVGPCFFEEFHGSDRFVPLMAELRSIAGPDGLHSLVAMQYLLANRGQDALGGGISAMPSLHVGIAVFASLAAFRRTRIIWVRGFSVIYVAFIFVGSVHLAWHYALDGVVAAVGVLVIWWAAGLFAERVLPSGDQANPEDYDECRSGQSFASSNARHI